MTTNERRYICFNSVTGNSLACGSSPADATDRAMKFHRFDDDRFLVVLDCEDRGEAVWQHHTLLPEARKRHEVVFRGADAF